MAPTAPLLDLDTLSTTRPSIRLDKKTYQLRNIDEFSFLSASQEAARFDRLRRLMAAKRSSKRNGAEISRILDEFCRLIIVDAPPAVHARMKDTHRVEIVQAFFLHERSRIDAAAATRTKGRPNRGQKTTSKSGRSSVRG